MDLSERSGWVEVEATDWRVAVSLLLAYALVLLALKFGERLLLPKRRSAFIAVATLWLLLGLTFGPIILTALYRLHHPRVLSVSTGGFGGVLILAPPVVALVSFVMWSRLRKRKPSDAL